MNAPTHTQRTPSSRRRRSALVAWLAMAGLVLSVMALLAMLMRGEPAGAQEVTSTVTDPGRIAYTSYNYEGGGDYGIYTMDPDGTDVNYVRPGASPAISPDGNKIAYFGYCGTSGTNGGICVMNADGTHPEQDVMALPYPVPGHEDLGFWWLQWSPDGTKLMLWEGNLYEIYTVNADGSGHLTNVTNTPDIMEFTPTWSSDGRIVYSAPEPGTWDTVDIYAMTMNPDGTTEPPVRLTNTPEFEIWPTYSPDGSKLAYYALPPGGGYSGDLYTVPADGSAEPTFVRHVSAPSGFPALILQLAWSPDGSMIAYHEDYDIFTIPASEEGAPINLTGTGEAIWEGLYGFSWGPSPSGVPDPTPPIILPNIQGTLGNSDWYTSDVTVSWMVTDLESPISSSSGCEPTTISSDTAGTTLTCEATSAGGTTTQPVTIKRDATKPTIDIARPAEGATYLLNQSVAADYSATDSGSGLAGSPTGTVESGQNIPTTAVGAKSFSVTATDVAGNQATLTHNYQVIYDFGGDGTTADGGGFLEPVSSSVLNTVTAGAGVPVKFSMGGDFGLDIFYPDYPTSRKIDCDTGLPTDPIEETLTISMNVLRYDATTGQYIYGWKTNKAWKGTCRQIVFKFQDESEHPVNFKFR